MFLTPEELDAILPDFDQDATDADAATDEDDEHGDYRFESDEFDGQPTEYEEWQDVYGGDDSIYEHDCDCMFDY